MLLGDLDGTITKDSYNAMNESAWMKAEMVPEGSFTEDNTAGLTPQDALESDDFALAARIAFKVGVKSASMSAEGEAYWKPTSAYRAPTATRRTLSCRIGRAAVPLSFFEVSTRDQRLVVPRDRMRAKCYRFETPSKSWDGSVEQLLEENFAARAVELTQANLSRNVEACPNRQDSCLWKRNAEIKHARKTLI